MAGIAHQGDVGSLASRNGECTIDRAQTQREIGSAQASEAKFVKEGTELQTKGTID